MTLPDKARRYLARMPPAISGAGGHDQTFRVACVLVQGFGLSTREARPLMAEYSTRCLPPWTDKEIDHKLADADRVQDPKGRGYLLQGAFRHTYRTPSGSDSTFIPHPSAFSGGSNSKFETRTSSLPPSAPQSCSILNHNQSLISATGIPLPAPVANGARALLLAAFQPSEGVRLCIARTGPDGRELPADAGVTLSREQWLKKLEAAHGDPNRFLRTTACNGIFISINPLKLGGSRDADVTAYRHCLLEFDAISIPEQWSLITQSRIPATAVIHSGGRSLHAWVRVDASTRAEYGERVRLLYAHFARHQPDPKNRNPSRFSRLPNCVRFHRRQELLALNLGADSFTAWQLEQNTAALGEEIQVKHLLEFDPAADSESLLGHRWLCRGGSCIIVGQSGTGKSSLEMQLAILWAIERPFCGLAPAKALKSLIIQAENDRGDLAEMFQGVWLGLKLGENHDLIRHVQHNVTFRRINTHTGPAFLDLLQRLIDHHRPDLVWLDPLLAYVGDDISKQSVCADFLRKGLNRISESTGVVWMIMHHTTKPPKDSKAKSNWTISDYAYEGSGSSDATNWAREVVLLRRHDADHFQLLFTKRGRRAGLRDLHGQTRDSTGRRLTSIWLKHSTEGICWEQTSGPDEDDKTAAKPTPAQTRKENRPGAARPFDYDAFLDSIKGEHFTATQLVERACKFSGISERTAWRHVIPELKTRLPYNAEFKTFGG